MRLTKSFRLLTAALLLPLAACVDMTGPGYVDDSCPVRRVDLGEIRTGSLSAYGCVMDYGPATFADFYKLRVYSTTWVDLWMESNHVDPYLVLYDEWDNVLAEDDDSLENLGAWIQVKLTPGVYYIAATTFDEGQTGRYTFGVE